MWSIMEVLPKVFLSERLIWGELPILTYNNTAFSRGFSLSAMYKYIQKHHSPNNFQLTGTWYMNFSNNLLTFSGFADWWREGDCLWEDYFFLPSPSFG